MIELEAKRDIQVGDKVRIVKWWDTNTRQLDDTNQNIGKCGVVKVAERTGTEYDLEVFIAGMGHLPMKSEELEVL